MISRKAPYMSVRYADANKPYYLLLFKFTLSLFYYIIAKQAHILYG